jgi:hypothetical protein
MQKTARIIVDRLMGDFRRVLEADIIRTPWRLGPNGVCC